MGTFVCFIVLIIPGAFSTRTPSNPLSDEFIDFINRQQSTWTAGRNFDTNTSMSYIYGLIGKLKYPQEKPIMETIQHSEEDNIPEFFDTREFWPDCEIINVIKDESSCSIGWAVAATSVMSDRICIHSNGQKQIYVSEEDLISCCTDCSVLCDYGYIWTSYIYWYRKGIVSGGPYNSTTGCKAYSKQPCEHYTNGSKPQCFDLPYDIPECKEQCDPQSSLEYKADKTFAKAVYQVYSRAPQIQLEILKNGPVEATFYVFSDFLSYKSGVYQRVSSDLINKKAVRIIGWGVENDLPYWLVANSWGDGWGDNGLFKIVRGKYECDIESEVYSALPLL